MKELKMSKFDIDSGKTSLEVIIKGNDGDSIIELKRKAIEFLVSGIDVGNDLHDESMALNEFAKDIILSATDLIGYEHFYREVTPDNEKHYNEYDELVVSKKGKLQLLELIVAELQEEVNKN